MPHVSRAPLADHDPEAGTSAVALPATPVEDPDPQRWYDADAVTFAPTEAGDAPAWIRAWPPETRSIETHVRALVVAARSSRR